MIGIPLGWAYGHVLEYGLHRFLHDRGRDRKSFWCFHFQDHHANARTNDFHDEIYDGHPFHWDAAGKELFGLGLLTLAHLPLAPIAPWFTATLAVAGAQYYYVHKKSHLDTEWAREHLPWHYDHHMGPNQHANWGVRSDIVDRIVGTREVYCGTDKELKDRVRRRDRIKKKLARKAAKAAETVQAMAAK